MSVCLYINKIIPNVEYIGTKYEKLNKEERKNIIDLPDEIFIEKFSDGKEHGYFNLTMAKSISKNCGKNRYWKKINKMNLPYNTITTTYGLTYHVTVVDKVVYRQGWFLKNRFFNKKCTMYMTNKKSEMISFMKQYFDFTDDRAKECYNTFIEKMEDGMLFSCDW